MTDLAWQDDALCAQTDSEIFFPEKGASAVPAKSICVACEVPAACLNYALEQGHNYGIYGGLTAVERRQLRRAS